MFCYYRMQTRKNRIIEIQTNMNNFVERFKTQISKLRQQINNIKKIYINASKTNERRRFIIAQD